MQVYAKAHKPSPEGVQFIYLFLSQKNHSRHLSTITMTHTNIQTILCGFSLILCGESKQSRTLATQKCLHGCM